MNRRILAALLTLADVHEAKERLELQDTASPSATDFDAKDSAYGRHGYCLELLSEHEYAVFEAMAIKLCEEALTIADEQGVRALDNARARTLPSRVGEELPASPIVPASPKGDRHG